ncbi:family 43 glycosylhydrolase [Echinimonas agarilytica]|uniref:Family 43 glycosylhydrolase n=1 Tax=Echinimonas agarilytica TaxID=1215918 RepID=A0AA41W4P8_9GAMM|nr:family 43 glycosylhydrolase [Echinimonas agarilytica]MCM2678711.1 family 43 glycosylhydrolase [Echinimonas agarilytica]
MNKMNFQQLCVLGLASFVNQTTLATEAPQLKYGWVDVFSTELQIPDTVKPILNDQWMRDTFIKQAPDGYYYMTGTIRPEGKSNARVNSPGIQLWRSKDMKDWEDLGLVYNPDHDDSWHGRLGKNKGKRHTVWAPEIHYIESQKTFFIIACTPYPERGTFVLRSTSGKAEGPYIDIAGSQDSPIINAIDGSLFEDDDGTVYLVSLSHKIARMKDDMSDVAEPFKKIKQQQYTPEPNVLEGAYIVKEGGQYHLILSAFSTELPDGSYNYQAGRKGNVYPNNKEMWEHFYSYDVIVASANSPYGPYSERYTSIVGAGHNNFFKDQDGRWWSTHFSNPWKTKNKRSFRELASAIPLRIEDGKFYPDFEYSKKYYGPNN